MVEQWLIDDYGAAYILATSDTTLQDLAQNADVTEKTVLVFAESPTTWRADFLANVVDLAQIPEAVQTELKVADLPMKQVNSTLIGRVDDDADDIESRLLVSSNTIFIILDAEDHVHTVLTNRVFSNADTESVQFTVFHPLAIVPETYTTIYLHAHLPDMLDDIRDQMTDNNQYVERLLEKAVDLKAGTRIQIVAEYDDTEFEFTSDKLTKRWDYESVQFAFEMMALDTVLNQQPSFDLSVQIFNVEIARITITLLVQATTPSQTMTHRRVKQHERIFISYSRRDTAVVRQYYLAQIAAGNDIFFDVESIRSGENWRDAIKEAIDEADFMQLFWSDAARDSENVAHEWQYLLDTKCTENDPSECGEILRPVYWQHPLPKVPAILNNFNFRYVPFDH